ncbi:unnamed protein product [Paramecium octaurelia]|uniref:Uncharacterized protein n=1 Tax=Paramecium octaurelia TaxID=43137 RepID=A0A8S1VL35_PAROT|nr:unnamed protein product [Paramecium octaurelia]
MEFIEQANTKLLINIVKFENKISIGLEAVTSPYPTVTIVIVAQYTAQSYFTISD